MLRELAAPCHHGSDECWVKCRAAFLMMMMMRERTICAGRYAQSITKLGGIKKGKPSVNDLEENFHEI